PHAFSQGWRINGYELQGPQTDVRDGERAVIADVAAAGLLGVAHKVFALVAPNALSRHHKHQNTKHKHHGQPDSTKHCRIFIDPVKKGLQS
uniref:Uncharacterized protein n=1 Tax=Cyprinus carpio TaxID=7962 RepID=A0A8C1GE53_CYPCA